MGFKENNDKLFRSLELNLNPTQSFKNLQQIMMTKKMQQAIAILQLPVAELSHVIAEELEHNPLLEYEDEDSEFIEELIEHSDFRFIEPTSFRESCSFKEKEESCIENYLTYSTSLFEHLMKQAKEALNDTRELSMVEWLIGNLDEIGFLSIPMEDLVIKDYKVEELERVLKIIQTFEPIGIGAKNLKDCLLFQLKAKGKEKCLAYQIIDLFYKELLTHDVLTISKILKTPIAIIKKAIINDIACLDLHPGLNFQSSVYENCLKAVIPDLSIFDEGGQIKVEINIKSIPSLKINPNYLQILEQKDVPQETLQYIQNKISSGKWLLKSIEERHLTLFRVAQEIASRQKEFLFQRNGQLKPLTMKTIAQKLGFNESTIARAIANKYAVCPLGVISLKSLFSNGLSTSEGSAISSSTVKDMIKKVISEENPKNPLSDEKIASLIKKQGIQCARRTVAKYRQELLIGSTSERRKAKSLNFND